MTETIPIRLPLLYFPPVSWFCAFAKAPEVFLGSSSFYRKQTYRNRCEILTANGKMKLSVPVSKPGLDCKFEDVTTDPSRQWQRQHWRTIQSAYNRSPFFLFYKDAIGPLFTGLQVVGLAEHNRQIINTLRGLIGLEDKVAMHPSGPGNIETVDGLDLSRCWLEASACDSIVFPGFTPYFQVFAEKYSFIPDLSVLDLLFNLGPESLSYLKSQSIGIGFD